MLLKTLVGKLMKIFPKRVIPTNFQDIFETTQQQLQELRLRKPQELVAVKSHGGGYEMQLQDVPDGEAFKLVRKLKNL